MSDVKQCDMCEKIADKTHGWYHVELEGYVLTYANGTVWDFCSVHCLSLWSFKRRKR